MAKKTTTAGKHASALPPSKWVLADRAGCGHTAHQGEPVREDDIRLLAYKKWEKAGKPLGDGVRFWLEAEQELRQNL
jgi:Protein of unknown function (DUF2934)